MENLEETGAFKNPRPTTERFNEQGLVRVDHRGQLSARKPPPGAGAAEGGPPVIRWPGASSSRSASLIIPVALGVVLNIAAHCSSSRPLALKSAGVADRAIAARRCSDPGRTRRGRGSRAGYRHVARRRGSWRPSTRTSSAGGSELGAATHAFLTVYHLARKMNVKFLDRSMRSSRRSATPGPAAWKIRTELQGDYENLRQFHLRARKRPRVQ